MYYISRVAESYNNYITLYVRALQRCVILLLEIFQ